MRFYDVILELRRLDTMSDSVLNVTETIERVDDPADEYRYAILHRTCIFNDIVITYRRKHFLIKNKRYAWNRKIEYTEEFDFTDGRILDEIPLEHLDIRNIQVYEFIRTLPDHTIQTIHAKIDAILDTF